MMRPKIYRHQLASSTTATLNLTTVNLLAYLLHGNNGYRIPTSRMFVSLLLLVLHIVFGSVVQSQYHRYHRFY